MLKSLEENCWTQLVYGKRIVEYCAHERGFSFLICCHIANHLSSKKVKKVN
jgi:hypothetical protein